VTETAKPRPPLDTQRLTTPIDWSVEVVDSAPSTNAVVADRARAGAGEGLVVVAEHQTAGRGRLDRTWETPARAALTLSVLLRPSATAVDWPWLPLMTGYAAGRTLRQLGAPVGLKWPNDVLLADRKVAGILTERIDTSTGPAVVVGIGINVDQARDELPLDSATSLALEGAEIDRTDLLTALLRSLRTEYDAFQRGELASLRAAYVDSCTTIGRSVRVDLPDGETLTGEATGIDEGGRLLVQTVGGVVPVAAGDVVHATITGS
jgi:BirA family biotin operon repressor/biotin-[acetyl-CoA-carboxylase] ligase